MTKHIAILRGDGIGPEIVAETVRVLDKLIAQGLDASYEYDYEIGRASCRERV